MLSAAQKESVLQVLALELMPLRTTNLPSSGLNNNFILEARKGKKSTKDTKFDQ